MDKKEMKNLGKDIKRIVNESLETGDYNKMGREVGQTMNHVLESTLAEVRNVVSEIQKESKVITVKPRQYRPADVKQGPSQMNTAIYFPHVPKGRVSNVLLTVFGSIGAAMFGMSSLALLLTGFSLPGLTVSIIGFLISMFMEVQGMNIRKRLKRYREYVGFLKGRNRIFLDELVDYSGKRHKFLIRDFKKMIDLGMFPQARFNSDQSVILLNRTGYDQYMLEVEEKKKKAQAIADKGWSEDEVHEMTGAVNEGKDFIFQIRKANEGIYDLEVSDKIYRMEHVVDQIIGHIENNPGQLSEVRRLMQFYLPTTVKLLNAYGEFEKQEIQGENIKAAKQEIRNSLDTINTAFENLYDNLFASASMDISADISVLQTMLAEEGLTEDRR